jgi:5,10-methylenetetrahydromethanopterin reductase
VTTPKLSVGLPPGPHCVEVARVAESLGCDRVWLFDSAALYEDIWIWLDRIARDTDLNLGTAVLVPNLRHVMTTASAIATIEHVAPGRLACGFGTGATARWVLGKKALSWATTRRYIENLRGLLAGEVVEVDGEKTQMIHWPGLAPDRPIRTPLLLSAMGPKGIGITKEICDGIITVSDEPVEMDWHVQMFTGTVLGDGESPDTPRVKDAVGPWVIMPYHGGFSFAPEVVDMLPNGAAWRASIEAARPEGERHLAVHEGHVTHVTDRDRELVLDASWELPMRSGLWIGTADEIRARAERAGANGVTEILYTPSGPDVVGELRRMAEALSGS